MRRFLLSLVILFPLFLHAATVPKWEKLEGCTLVKGSWMDGDSFTVRIAPRTFRVFRLYFVDTPEGDKRYPARNAEQAEYFGITTGESIQLAGEASKFTEQVLSAGPFTVYTLWQGLGGTSKRPRFYGYVVTERGPLCQLLVSNGLARIYGKRITLPDGTDSKAYRAKLEGLELQAKKQGKGGWGDFSDGN